MTARENGYRAAINQAERNVRRSVITVALAIGLFILAAEVARAIDAASDGYGTLRTVKCMA
ncbi:MAG: hypothetical protein ABI629_24945 [bacterium]